MIKIAVCDDEAAMCDQTAEMVAHILRQWKESFEMVCCLDPKGSPKEGIGLSNLKAAAEKYQGTVETSAGSGIFRLDLLLVLPWTPIKG